MEYLIITKIVCLFLAILFGVSIAVRTIYGLSIFVWNNMVPFAIGLTGFIYLQWLM